MGDIINFPQGNGMVDQPADEEEFEAFEKHYLSFCVVPSRFSVIRGRAEICVFVYDSKFAAREKDEESELVHWMHDRFMQGFCKIEELFSEVGEHNAPVLKALESIITSNKWELSMYSTFFHPIYGHAFMFA